MNHSHFFVCYSHRDADAVHDEIRWIEESGIALWYDRRIHVGAVWRSEIVRAMTDSIGMLFFSSAQSAESEQCTREINFMLDKDKRVIVIQLDDTPLPDYLQYSLQHRQALVRSAYPDDEFRQRLLESMNALGSTGDFPVFETGADSVRRVATTPAMLVMPVSPLGLGDDVDMLARQIGSSLIARATTRVWQVRVGVPEDEDIPPTLLGIRRDVAYIIKCELQHAGTAIRLIGHLRETDKGEQVWSRQYDRPADMSFEAQDQLVAAVVNDVFEVVLRREGERFKDVPDEALDTWGLCTRAMAPLHDRQTADRARALLELAIARDPDYALAHGLYGLKLGQSIYSQFSDDPEQDAKLAVEHVETALRLDPEPILIVSFASIVHRMVGDLEYASLLAERATRMAGRYQPAHLEIMITRGQFEEAYECGASMDYDKFLAGYMAIVCLMLNRLDEALAWSRRGTVSDPDRYNNWACLAAVQAQLGNEVEARSAWQRACALSTAFTVERFDLGMRLAWRGRKDIGAALTGGLRELGLT